MNIHQKIKTIIDKRLSVGKFLIDDLTIISLSPKDYNELIEYEKDNPEFDKDRPTFLGKKVIKSNSTGGSRVYFTHKNQNKSVGIIGTAGRGEDSEKLGVEYWNFMVEVSGKLVQNTCSNVLVSGGAAWADHVAVWLFLKNKKYFNLRLHLPAPFENGKYSENTEAGRVSNFYHKKFSQKLGVDTLKEIDSAIKEGCYVSVSKDGFFARNNLVAFDSNTLLAFTFGEDKHLKDGGTKNTFETFLKKENRGLAFHCNLNDTKLYIY